MPQAAVSRWFNWPLTDGHPRSQTTVWKQWRAMLMAACETESAVEVAQEGPTPGALVTTLIGALTAFGREVMLVVDDYQRFTQLQVHELFQALLDGAPAKLHLLFVSRLKASLSLMRLQDNG